MASQRTDGEIQLLFHGSIMTDAVNRCGKISETESCVTRSKNGLHAIRYLSTRNGTRSGTSILGSSDGNTLNTVWNLVVGLVVMLKILH